MHNFHKHECMSLRDKMQFHPHKEIVNSDGGGNNELQGIFARSKKSFKIVLMKGK